MSSTLYTYNKQQFNADVSFNSNTTFNGGVNITGPLNLSGTVTGITSVSQLSSSSIQNSKMMIYDASSSANSYYSSISLNKNASSITFQQQGSTIRPTLPTPTGTVWFGISNYISPDGNTMAIGSLQENSLMGAVRVYSRSGTTWTRQGVVITPTLPTPTDNVYFGLSVSLSSDGNTMAVSSTSENSNIGAVRIFTRNTSTLVWSQQGNAITPTSPTPTGNVYFGQSVSLSFDGNTLAVGGYYENTATGTVRVYSRSGTTWTHQAYITPTLPTATGGQFGNSVSLSSDGYRMAVGSPTEDGGKGAARVFIRDASNVWTQQGNALTGPTAGGSYFGYSVSLSSSDGTTLAVGSQQESSGIGALRVFTRSGTTWSQQGGTITPTSPTPSGGVYFGQKVCISSDGNKIAVGATGENSGVGTVRVFNRTGTTWSQTQYITPTSYTSAAQFGYSGSFSSDGNILALGGYNENSAIGAVSVYYCPTYISLDVGDATLPGKLSATSKSGTYSRFQTDTDGTGEVAGIEFGTSGLTVAQRAKITSTRYDNSASDLQFCTNAASGTTASTSMTITKDGYVGIGTTTPSYKLDVNGTANFSGATTIGGTLALSSGNGIYLNGNGSVNCGSGAVNCGTLGCTSINTNSGTVSVGLGAVNCGAISCTTLTTNYNTITCGTITCGSINSSGVCNLGPITVDSCNWIAPGTGSVTYSYWGFFKYYYIYGTWYTPNSSYSISTSTLDTTYNYPSYGLKCTYNIYTAAAFVTASDNRIKNNIVEIDDDNALSILRKIKPKTYEYIDKLKRGNDSVIGFIAQEIKEIIPKAVTVVTDYAPTFYTICQISTTDVSNIVLVTSPIDLSWNPLHDQSGNAFIDGEGNACSDASGNKVFNVKLYDQSNNEIKCKTTFILDKRSFLMDISGSKMVDNALQDGYFLHGQEVDDFHTIDKSAIFTVVTAAVQDIDRIVQAQTATQQADAAKIAALEGQVSTLQTQNASYEARIAALEQALTALLAK